MKNTYTLYLLRHAKSSWEEAELSDFDRPLSPRGCDAAPRMGRYMRKQGFVPDLILCSPARRARQTLDLVMSKKMADTEIKFIDALYNFGDGTDLIHIIAAEGGIHRQLLVVGHNPTMQGAASKLIDKGNEQDRKRLLQKYPTAGLAVINFDTSSWEEIIHTKGRLEHFVRPKDLHAD